jgi:hypothetical protein
LRAVERYRFVSESAFDIDKILNCVRLAAKALVTCDQGLEATVKRHLERIASTDRSDQYAVLDALREVDNIIAHGAPVPELDGPLAITFHLIRLTWGCTFMNYFWLKKQRDAQPKEPPSS